jgi:hypothetical protein
MRRLVSTGFALWGLAAHTAAAQVALTPLGISQPGHLRLNDALPSRFSGASTQTEGAKDPRTQWELGAEISPEPRGMDKTSPNGKGRWFVFAAAGGRAVGLNMSPTGAPGAARWSSGSTSTLINDGQAGVGWRRGAMQASFGYVHRDISGSTFDPYAAHTRNLSDSMVGLSFSLHSR